MCVCVFLCVCMTVRAHASMCMYVWDYAWHADR
jgi:hypothetical protein